MALWNKYKILPAPIVILLRVSSYPRQKSTATKLAEVGKFEVPKVQGKYDAGQLFLHKVFGYRGVILFPWVARLYDRIANKKSKSQLFVDDIPGIDSDATKDKEKDKTNSNTNDGSNEMQFEVATYYQALIDRRDCPHIRAHLDVQAVTFLGRDKDMYAVPGLDYVNHEDVLPYISTEKLPMQHELFDRFLTPDQTKIPPLTATHELRIWHEENHKWLELSDVHRETTENIRVTVIPFYMGSMQQNKTYWWRYCIRLENLSNEAVQLCERHWRIFSLSGTLESLRGSGVVGQQPILSPLQPAFQYTSHVSLQSASGHMWGTYRMERPDGSKFDVRIPPFSLESKEDPYIV